MIRLGAAWGLAVAALCAAAVPSRAYVPTAEEIFTQLGLQVPTVSRAIFETHTLVFDAAPRPADRLADAPGGVEPEPVEVPAREYRQRVYWIRDQLLAVETLAQDGTPLHVYLDEGVEPVSRDLQPARHFETVDVVHPYIPFMGGRPTDWRDALSAWGIDPWQVGLRPGYKLRNLYRIGAPGGPAAYLDPDRLALVAIETRILNGAHPIALRMDFGNALILGDSPEHEEQLYFPRVVTFSVNGRMFKQVRVTDFRADPPPNAFPLNRLRDEAATTPRSLTLQTNLDR